MVHVKHPGPLIDDANYKHETKVTLNHAISSTKSEDGFQKANQGHLVCIYASIILSAIACSLALYSIIGRAEAPAQRVAYHFGNNICVSCDLLDADDTRLSDRKYTETADLCCFSNQTETTGITVAAAIARNNHRGVAKNSFHALYQEDDRTYSLRGHALTSVRSWITDGGHARLGSGIALSRDRGGFTITERGSYMVYSHVTFQRSLPEEQNARLLNSSFIIHHDIKVRKADDNRVMTLMQDSAQVECPVFQDLGGVLYPCHVSSLIGLLWLHEGDTLSLEVTPIQHLLGDNKSTYFGIYLVE